MSAIIHNRSDEMPNISSDDSEVDEIKSNNGFISKDTSDREEATSGFPKDNKEWNAIELMRDDNRHYFDIKQKNYTKGMVSKVEENQITITYSQTISLERLSTDYSEGNKNKSSVKKVVTQIGDNQLLFEFTENISFDRCHIPELSVGDFVGIEKTENNEIVVKPMEYKILIGKISYDQTLSGLIFSHKAVLPNNRSTKQLKVGDIITCVVMKTTIDSYSWKAYPYDYIIESLTEKEIIKNNNELTLRQINGKLCEQGISLSGNIIRENYLGKDVFVVPIDKRGNGVSKYAVPKKLWHSFLYKLSVEKVFPELGQPLTTENYQVRMHSLLYLEECASQMDLKKYNMYDIKFKRDGSLYKMSVPGLEDGRPSLIEGDRVLIFSDDSPIGEDLGFEGVIDNIRRDEILIRFSKDFCKLFKGERYSVIFQVNRTVWRRCHHGIDFVPQKVIRVLFPSSSDCKNPLLEIESFNSMNWFNAKLDEQQKKAVVGALRAECRPSPYIIFGPPGTGKTVTVVELIIQVFNQISQSQLLVCAGTNNSVESIAEKLLESNEITKKDLILITSFQRSKSSSKSEVLEDVIFTCDNPPDNWLRRRIIITTTSQAGVFLRYRMNSTHFTHLIIDEAAQVTEPESLIPISIVLDKMTFKGVIVLTGDHKQLGPVVNSFKAKECGFVMSTMERMITSIETYKRKDSYKMFGYYDPKFAVKLINNYRSNAQIMSVPSQLFYDNELKFTVEMDHKLLLSLKIGFPINFVGVNGTEGRDADSPSVYNRDEIKEVYSYCKKLSEANIDSEDIGIITPYRKQMKEIRNYLKSKGLDYRVGTIEEFQGLEKRVIILSTVRSENLGFVSNPKRFNVAISRAKDLLIVIGNARLLYQDLNWRQLIHFCEEHKCYSGTDLDEIRRGFY